MSGPAIAAHAAQNTQAAGVIATKFIKPSHATEQAAFGSMLQKLATRDSQPQTGDDVKSGAEDAAKDGSSQEKSGSGNLQVTSDADPAATIAALLAPQSSVDASTAAIAALLASPAQIDANAAAVRQASQPNAASVNAQAFGAKTSSSATQAWAARLQAQSQIGDIGEARSAAMPSDSTAQIAATTTPTVAPTVVDVRVQSARTFLGLDNSVQIAGLNADNNAPTSGAKATIAAAVDAKQNTLSTAASNSTLSSAANPLAAEASAAKQDAPLAAAAWGATASSVSSNAAVPVPAEASTTQNATPAPSSVTASNAATMASTEASTTQNATPTPSSATASNAATVASTEASTTQNATPAPSSATASNAATMASTDADPAGDAATRDEASVAINSDPGAVRVRGKADGALQGSATGLKAGPAIPGSAPAGSNAGQQAAGGSTQRNTSNGSRGAGGSLNNNSRADGAIASSAASSIGASTAAGVAAVTAAAVGPLTVDQLPDLVANQAATLTASAQTPAGATAANLNPVKELNVQLNPADLGSLTVKMRLANGNLAVVIEASKDSTAKMIAGERGAIAERLASVDQPLASVTVQAAGSGPHQGDNSNGSSATPQQGDAQSGAANGFNGSDGEARSSRGDDSRSQAGQANSADDQTSGRSVTGDLFV